MNILLCGASMGIGGAETHMLSLASELSRLGHRITVAAERGELCGELKRRGIRFIRVPLSDGGVRNAAKSYSILRRILRRWDFDVVHAHSRLSALIVSLVRQKERLDFGFVVTAHARYKTTRALRLLSVWGDRCIAVSEDIKWHLVKYYGVEPGRITVIPNGIDTDRFCLRGEGDVHSVLFISRLDADCSKGAVSLCRIAPKLCLEFPDARITIVGGGDRLESVRALADRANRAVGRECVTCLGKCPEVSGLIAEHGCVVGVSRVALEAMAMEKPVILFGDEGALGMLNDDVLPIAAETNFTCRGHGRDKGDAFLLSELRRAFNVSAEERAYLCRLGRRAVRENHSLRKMGEETLSVYGEKGISSPRITVGGYYGFGNLGDESVLKAVTEALHGELPDCSITAFTRKGRAVDGVEGVSFARRADPISVMTNLRESDIYISGGGSLLQNRTSMRSLAYYCAMLMLAKLLGNKSVVLSNGIGPLHGRLAERMARRTLLSADYVSVRDMDSFLKVISLTGGRVCPSLSADPVFLLSDEAFNKKERKGLLECGAQYAAVALNGRDGSLNCVISKAVGEYCRLRGLFPVFVPMDMKTDADAAREGAKISGGVMLGDVDRERLCRVLKNASLAVGSRLHFLVFALLMDAPFVPLSSDPKVESFSYEIFGSPAVRLGIGDSPLHVRKRIERFIAENHKSFDGEARQIALDTLSLRAKGDIKRVSELCSSCLKKITAKPLKKTHLSVIINFD